MLAAAFYKSQGPSIPPATSLEFLVVLYFKKYYMYRHVSVSYTVGDMNGRYHTLWIEFCGSITNEFYGSITRITYHTPKTKKVPVPKTISYFSNTSRKIPSNAIIIGTDVLVLLRSNQAFKISPKGGVLSYVISSCVMSLTVLLGITVR